MNKNTILSFLIGVAIGFLFVLLISSKAYDDDHTTPLPNNRIFSANTKRNKIKEATMADVKKIRILCILTTTRNAHTSRAIHIFETWGKHCDKLLFASTLTDNNINAVRFNVTNAARSKALNGHDVEWEKTKLMLHYIYRNFLDEFDWIYKGEDDSFMIGENLRFMLSAYSPEDPIYFGYKYNTPEHKRGYLSGGSGYAMSRQTVRTFVEEILLKENIHKGMKVMNHCHIKSNAHTADWRLTLCLDNYNIYVGNSQDPLNRERFLIFTPETHLFMDKPAKNWYWNRKYYWNVEGLDCCSNYSIAFHEIQPKYQYSLYFLTYGVQAYGIERRFPPPPIAKAFSDITERLDRERFNKTLRGF